MTTPSPARTTRVLLCRGARWSAAFFLALTVGACARLAAADPNALWKIVDLRCVPSQQATGTPGQCTLVNLDQHYVILKDIVGRSQHLLIPTDRITGIESPLLLAPHARDYWVDAWDSRAYVEKSVKRTLPDTLLGIEINSEYRRSQNQLHIHIDCMRRDISEALARHANDAPGRWQWDTLDGNRYRIMHVMSLAQRDDPFRLVARGIPGLGAGSDPDHDAGKDADSDAAAQVSGNPSGNAEGNNAAMATQTILVTGAGPSAAKDGWLVVNSDLEADNGSGSAEGLLDHKCRVADGD
ncbi:CDP-diacylglycerol diphosphatase [Paraburkholderia sp. PREW-6R]|uniref:CDP-diacylglycerol diphosphatase n=1 Tax=Paraburkholderia sp. PREW-6R TaxID=3141544 RepID=UPI0031F5AA71